VTMNINKEKRNAILEMIGHLCVGLSILMKGISKFDHPGNEMMASLFILAGVVVISGSFLHKRLEPVIGNFKLYIFVIESLVLGVLGYTYMIGGSRLMFYFYYLASALFIVAAMIHLFYVLPKEKKHISENDGNEKGGESNSIASQEEKI
jgi:hypothetical protein